MAAAADKAARLTRRRTFFFWLTRHSSKAICTPYSLAHQELHSSLP